MPHSVIAWNPAEFAEALEASVFAADGAAGFQMQNIWDRVRDKTGAEYVLWGDHCLGVGAGAAGLVLSRARVLPSLSLHPLRRVQGLAPYLQADRREEFFELSDADLAGTIPESDASSPYDLRELNYFLRSIHYHQPKCRILSRHGIIVRTPWLDLDVINYVRRLPLKYARRKRLYQMAVQSVNPTLASMPVAREGETVDYRPFLAEAERRRRAVTKLVLADNPLLAEFFDPAALEGLIARVCAPAAAGGSAKPAFDPLTLIPLWMRAALRDVVYYFTNPPPKLSGSKLVLAIATVAVALRQLSNLRRSGGGT
jgi:hypothetical protein